MQRAPVAKSEVLARADAAWLEWQRFLESQTAAPAAEARGADGWTLAEAVAHVARWQEWSLPRVGEIAAGGRVVEVDVDGLNAEWAEHDSGISFGDASARLERSWAALRAAADSVPEERWSRRLTALLKANTWEHYDEHARWRGSAL